MKSHQPKIITSPNFSHSPFFQKERNNNFFRKSNKPFFNALPIQTKLTVNQPNDPYEIEADAMADKVMQQISDKSFSTSDNNSAPVFQNSNSIVQRNCTECEKEQKLQRKEKGDEKDVFPNKLQTKPIFESNAEPTDDEKKIQRKCDECDKEEKIQKKMISIQRQEETNSNIQEQAPSQELVSPSPQSSPDSGEQAPGQEPVSQTQESVPGSEEQPAEATEQESEQGQFIVGDSATPLDGQMRKSDFLDRLNTEVCGAVDEALQGTKFSSNNCPYIRAAFARHRNSSPVQLEQTIQRYEPSATSAQSAEDLIQQMKIRVTASATRWVQTGDLSDAPEDIVAQIPASLRTVAGIGATASDSSQPGSGGEGAAPGTSSILFKANPGGAHASQSPTSVKESLGKGNSIDGSTRGKMENAFGTSFSDVEIHTDNKAASLSGNMNARAFTVDNHIAFANGEHKPGTLVGDALMAHELAHVIQQKGMDDVNAHSESVLEEDADTSAVTAVVSALGGMRDLRGAGKRSMPRLKSGLKISRCTPKVRTLKTMPLDVFELFEHTLSPESEIEGASRIWTKGCGIQFTMNKKVVDAPTTRRLIGDDLEVTYMGNDLPSEDQNNLKGTLGVSNRTFATVFFVKSLAAASQGGTDPLATAIYIGTGKCGAGFTLAHEMGHVLKLGGRDPHHNSSSSLMTTPNCLEGIDSTECDAVRGD